MSLSNAPRFADASEPAFHKPPVIHFLSDLHLSSTTTGVHRLFLDYLNGPARSAEKVFILGDLFDAWPGDDSIDDPETPINRCIIDALRELTRSGVDLCVMHGNRDFLLGDAFAHQTGAMPLPDPYLLALRDGYFVLSHGDMLCTDDTDYQRLRAQLRGSDWKVDFLNKSLHERKAIAARLRQQSENAKREKLERSEQYLMELNRAATDDFLRLSGYATFIHGHTHQAATHDHLIDGIHVERWVMADWREDRGEYIVWNGHTLKRESLE